MELLRTVIVARRVLTAARVLPVDPEGLFASELHTPRGTASAGIWNPRCPKAMHGRRTRAMMIIVVEDYPTYLRIRRQP